MNPLFSAGEPYFWKPACWLKLSGPDASGFLQGQFTNDLRKLPADRSVYGLWLDQKGRVVADSFVLAGSAPDEFLVGSYFCPADAIRRRLEAYLVADEVAIEDPPPQAAVSLVGEGGGAWLAAQPRPGVFFPGRRGRGENWDWVFPAAEAESVRAYFSGKTALSLSEMERRRIRARIPAVPRDIGPSDLPQEGGLEEDAVSFGKGCYLGQEVMARLKSRGRLRRSLARVSGRGGPPSSLPAPLWQDGRKLGELRSAAADGDGFSGLAMLPLDPAVRARPLFLSSDGMESCQGASDGQKVIHEKK